jgi:hypothetical protein
MTEQERANRNARYAEGYHYAAKQPGLTVAQQKDFANRYADEYSLRGMEPAEAWKVYIRQLEERSRSLTW